MRAYLAILLVAAAAIPLRAADREKAEKQIRMMTAISRDDAARSIAARLRSGRVMNRVDKTLPLRTVTLRLGHGSIPTGPLK
jgi:hypothetical protein